MDLDALFALYPTCSTRIRTEMALRFNPDPELVHKCYSFECIVCEKLFELSSDVLTYWLLKMPPVGPVCAVCVQSLEGEWQAVKPLLARGA